MTPAVPLPLLVPMTSTLATPSNTSAGSSWPTVYSPASSLRSSTGRRRGVHQVGAKLVPARALAGVLGASCRQAPPRHHARLGEVPTRGLVRLEGVDLTEPERDGGGPGDLGGAHRGHDARPRLDDG